MFHKDSQYHRITVSDWGGVRSLRFGNRRQSALRLDDGLTSDIEYTDYLHLGLAMKPDAQRVLVIGLGGGALPKRMWHDYPDVRVDVVEIDPAVIDVAKRYFGMPDDQRLRVFTGDGRRFVASTKERYDIVVVDAYFADSIPFHLTTAEFFRQVRGVLHPRGAVAYNLIASVEGDSSRLFRSFYRTLGEVWREVHVFAIDLAVEQNPRSQRNIVVLAGDSCDGSTLLARIRDRVGGRVSLPRFDRFGADLYREPVALDDVPVLTDGSAPADSRIHL